MAATCHMRSYVTFGKTRLSPTMCGIARSTNNSFGQFAESTVRSPTNDGFRIVLADPPIDWSEIKGFEDLLPWLKQRPFDEAAIVEREVLAKHRRALLIAGAGHHLNGSPLLKVIRAHGVDPLKIWTTTKENLADLQSSVRSWPRPSLTFIKGTVLGKAGIRSFYGSTGAGVPPGPLEKQFDAILYLGPPSSLTQSHIAPELCSDQRYLDMRLPRLRMQPAGRRDVEPTLLGYSVGHWEGETLVIETTHFAPHRQGSGPGVP
jgi:hypothetical protein